MKWVLGLIAVTPSPPQIANQKNAKGAPPSIFRVYPPWRVGLEFFLKLSDAHYDNFAASSKIPRTHINMKAQAQNNLNLPAINTM